MISAFFVFFFVSLRFGVDPVLCVAFPFFWGEGGSEVLGLGSFFLGLPPGGSSAVSGSFFLRLRTGSSSVDLSSFLRLRAGSWGGASVVSGSFFMPLRGGWLLRGFGFFFAFAGGWLVRGWGLASFLLVYSLCLDF